MIFSFFFHFSLFLSRPPDNLRPASITRNSSRRKYEKLARVHEINFNGNGWKILNILFVNFYTHWLSSRLTSFFLKFNHSRNVSECEGLLGSLWASWRQKKINLNTLFWGQACDISYTTQKKTFSLKLRLRSSLMTYWDSLTSRYFRRARLCLLNNRNFEIFPPNERKQNRNKISNTCSVNISVKEILSSLMEWQCTIMNWISKAEKTFWRI